MKLKNNSLGLGLVLVIIIIIGILYGLYNNKYLDFKNQEVVKIDKQDINDLKLTDDTVSDR
jgi:hypothetical protein